MVNKMNVALALAKIEDMRPLFVDICELIHRDCDPLDNSSLNIGHAKECVSDAMGAIINAWAYLKEAMNEN